VFNKIRKTNLCIIMLLLLIILNIIGCQLRKGKIPIETVALGGISHSILYAPVYIAISQGFFTGENLDIEYKSLRNNQELINCLDDDIVQIIMAGSQVPILAKGQSEGSNLTIFAQLVDKDPSYLLSRDKQESFSWDKVNKKIIIGGLPYSTPQLILEYLLLQNNLQPYKKVDVIQNIPQEACIGAFKGGVGDFIHLLEPEASRLVNEGNAYLALGLGEKIGDIAYTTLITKAAYLKEKPEVVQRFVNALYQSQLWCNYHSPEEITKELTPFFPELDREIILSVVSNYKSSNTWSQNPLIKQEALDKMQEILVTSGVMAEKRPWETMVDNSFAQKAVEEVKIPKEYLKE
jgi:NitT/TauT family transport system substrate-binding protein